FADRTVALIPEQHSRQRQVAEERDLVLPADGRLAEQPADHDRVPVLDHDVAGHFGRALGGQTVGVDLAAGVFRVHFHADVTVGGDVRPEGEPGTGLEAFNGLAGG